MKTEEYSSNAGGGLRGDRAELTKELKNLLDDENAARNHASGMIWELERCKYIMDNLNEWQAIFYRVKIRYKLIFTLLLSA
jgi:hypothetical protein